TTVELRDLRQDGHVWKTYSRNDQWRDTDLLNTAEKLERPKKMVWPDIERQVHRIIQRTCQDIEQVATEPGEVRIRPEVEQVAGLKAVRILNPILDLGYGPVKGFHAGIG